MLMVGAGMRERCAEVAEHLIPARQCYPAPVVGHAAGLHDPLDRLALLLYIPDKSFTIHLSALHHLAGTDTLGNLVNGLGQNHCNVFRRLSPVDMPLGI